MLCLLILVPLWPQEDDPVAFVGLTLEELISRFGIPKSVYAARGLQEWQDDVVFVYDRGDFYIYKNRVWQAGLRAAMGIRTGDSRGLVSMVLDSIPGQSRPETRGDSIFYILNKVSWPLMLRFDFDRTGLVQAIFIYRTDF